MKLKILMAITIATILICAATVSAANVTYPQEYYALGQQSNNIFLMYPDISQFGSGGSYPSISIPSVISAIELRRQTILMEKQNELQAELVKAQWVETCYAPRYEGGANHANFSAWISECANAGYPI